MDWRESDTLPDGGTVAMQQHRTYGRACAALGTRALTFSAGPSRDPLAVAQVLVRRWPLFGNFALLARGPVWMSPVSVEQARVATNALVRLLRSHFRGVIMTGEPVAGVDPLAGAGFLPLFSAGVQARLDLGGSQAARLAMQHGKWRNRLRRGEASGMTVEHGPMPAETGHWLLRAEEAQARARRYRRLPASFTAAWVAANGDDSARLFVARQRGEIVAAMLFLLHGRAASYHIGWSGPEGRAGHAHNLLLWQASNWLNERGHTCVDLGTLDTDTTPGLARFKLGSGAQPVMLGTTWLDAPGTRLVGRLARCGGDVASGEPASVPVATAADPG